MNRLFYLVLIVLLLSCHGLALADGIEDTETYHPWLTDRFLLSVGAFLPSKEITLSARGSVDSSDKRIDLDESFRGSKREDVLAAMVHWRFGERWWLSGEWYKTSFEGSAQLEEDIAWNGVIFPAGSNASAGFGTQLQRLVIGRQIYSSDRSDLGIGFGFHLLELNAFIEGEVVIEGKEVSGVRERVSASAPLPNLTAWYIYSWAPRWAFIGRLDWLSASFKEYSGQIVNANAGVNFQLTKHFGLAAMYKHFELDVDVDKRGWYGASEYTQSGLFVSLTANW